MMDSISQDFVANQHLWKKWHHLRIYLKISKNHYTTPKFSSMTTAQFRDSRAVGSIFFVCQKNRSSSSNFQDEELHQICIKPSWTIGQVKHLGQQRLALKPRGFASSDCGNMYRIYSILVLRAGFPSLLQKARSLKFCEEIFICAVTKNHGYLLYRGLYHPVMQGVF